MDRSTYYEPGWGRGEKESHIKRGGILIEIRVPFKTFSLRSSTAGALAAPFSESSRKRNMTGVNALSQNWYLFTGFPSFFFLDFTYRDQKKSMANQEFFQDIVILD